MLAKRELIPGDAYNDQAGQAFAELLLILAPLTAILAFAVCMVVIASST